MAVELATAYISLVPSMRGFSAAVGREMAGVGAVAGQEGEKAGGKFSSKFSGVLKSGLAAGGVLAGVALAKGLLDSLDNEKTGDKLAAQLGVEGKRAEEIGSIAGKLYADAYGDSLATVNEAVKNVLQQGLVPEDATNAQIESITAKALDLASAFDQDMSKSASAVGTLLKTGLAKDADEAFDVITRGFQEGVDKQGDFLDTLIEYPTLFRNLGLDAKAATGLLSQGLAAGARDADKVADALKEFSIRAVDGSKLTAEGFAAIGLNADEMAQKIGKGGPTAAAALDLTLEKLAQIEDPAARAQAAVALFGTQAEDLGDALYALDPGDAAKGLGDVAGAAERMGDTLNDNAATKIEAFKRQALQGLANFIGNVAIPAIEDISGWVSKNLPKAMDKARPYIERFREIFDSVLKAVRDVWPQIEKIITSVVETLGSIFDAYLTAYAALWRTFGDDLLGFMRRVWEPIQMVITGALDVIQGVIKVVTGIISGDWSEAWEGIKQVFSGVWRAIQGIVRAALEVVRTLMAVAWQVIRGVLQRAWDGMRTAVSNAIDGIVGFVRALPGRAVSALGNIIGTLVSKGRDLIQGLRNGAESVWEGLRSWVAGLPGRLASAIPNPLSVLANIGRQLIEGLWNGISEKIDWLKRKLNGLVELDIAGTVAKAAGIRSPSRMMAELGRYMGDGLALGIEGSAATVSTAADGLARSAFVAPDFGLRATIAPPAPVAAPAAAAAGADAGGDRWRRGVEHLTVLERVDPRQAERDLLAQFGART